MFRLTDLVKNGKIYDEVYSLLTSGHTPVAVTGMGQVSREVFCHALSQKLCARALVIVPDEAAARKTAKELAAFFEDPRVFPAREIDFFAAHARSHEWECERLSALFAFDRGGCDAVVATPEALLQPTMAPNELEKRSFTVKLGDTLEREKLVEKLLFCGYTRCELIEGRGQFAVRGGIVDFFPPTGENPVRLELWGDEVDSLGFFDVQTQRRTENIKEITVGPVSELALSAQDGAELLSTLKKLVLRTEKRGGNADRLRADAEALEAGTFTDYDRYAPLSRNSYGTFFDYAADTAVFFFDEVKIAEHIKGYFALLEEDMKACVEKGLVLPECAQILPDKEVFYRNACAKPCVFLESFSHAFGTVKPKSVFSYQTKQLSGFAGSTQALIEDARGYLAKGFIAIAAVNSKTKAKAVSEILENAGVPTYDASAATRQGAVGIVELSLAGGVEFTEERIAVLCDGEEVKARRSTKRKSKNAERIKSYNDLHVGDYVVHSTHGVGKYMGIAKLEVQGVIKDYIKLKYAGTDILYIPTNQLDLISKYVSADSGVEVKLSKMGSAEWAKTKSRVKTAVKDMAEKLIKLYSEREHTRGFAFSPDTEWQRDFEGYFPYEETEDQLRSAEEIKRDMEKPVPMDRLLCGDVGFGKTEVALRAVFKCVSDGKQAAILVPTTILAWQHFETIQKRFSGIPVNIEVMSRYRTKKQLENIVRRLARGEIDIVVGTHRLLQKDIKFKALGLVVVDEEQRFGVAHKERLKEMTREVDVLTLSATPIPRTLNMALSGIRDMSLLEEPPKERQTVATYVLEYDFSVALEAIRQELRRGGQVLYLHNRVESIEQTAAKLARALPEAKVTFAHGKMGEGELSEIWESVVAGEVDVLVCTTIIETGIDLPNANTLIIEDADRMGLSQLYQLRGRVGRSHRRAYCYLTYRRGRVLTEEAEKRLSAIREFTEFGSGFKIAMRDLEIRGAGNVLGAEQHGHMEAVGYDLYVKLLENAIKMQKGEKALPERECVFDVNVSAHIPFEYIESAEQRIDVYKKIATIATREDYYDMTDELLDRFGEIPEAVDTLCRISLVRNMGTRCGIDEISEENGRVVFVAENFDMRRLSAAAEELSGRMTFIPSPSPRVTVVIKRGNSVVDEAEIFLNLYSEDTQ